MADPQFITQFPTAPGFAGGGGDEFTVCGVNEPQRRGIRRVDLLEMPDDMDMESDS